MINPFDYNFFKFLIGFVCILAISFAVIYFVNNYGKVHDNFASPSISR